MSRVLRFPAERRTTSPAPLVPLVPARGRVPDDIDRTLSGLASDPDALSPPIRNALFIAYGPILNRIARKVWWTYARRHFVDPDDVENEGFIVFGELLARWSGDGSFTRYLLARYPWRLRDRVSHLNGRTLPVSIVESLALSATDSWEAERALALLDELLQPLAHFDRTLVVMRVVEQQPARTIAAQLGVSTSTIESRWATLRIDLYRNLQLLLNNFE
ncbi:MAG: sigma-70 family RNA polymerase sigma factor [Thermomicrobiales bacterium]|nr:sigma-70 family RNA polymerase sigma factor [Thermomicrobiales bacterium]